MRVLPALLLATALAVPAVAAAPGLPGAPGCPVFPADNAWNQRVDGRPVAADSERLIATIGASTGLHPDVTGAPDARWDDDALHTLGRVRGSDLEVVAPPS